MGSSNLKGTSYVRKKWLYYIIIINVHLGENKSEKWFDLLSGGVMNMVYNYIVNRNDCG